MSKRFGLFGVCVVSSVCFLLLLATHQLSSYSQRQQPDFRRNIQSYSDQNIHPEYNFNTPNESVPIPSIKEIITQQRMAIMEEMITYPFSQGKKLEDYTLNTGGRPLRNIIVTSWRSGSTFLGEIINTIPGNYYHYEPLLDYDIMQIRGPPFSAGAIASLKRLLNCNYVNMKHYLEYGEKHVYLFSHNTRLWEQCQQHPYYCWNSTFLGEFCRLFPFQSMKIVRLRLRLAEELLKDETLGVRVLLLVRDPRGTLQSRKHRNWCPGHRDCDDPATLCADLVSDYGAASRLKKLYPDRFEVIRYEDFSQDPYRGVDMVFSFFQLVVSESVHEFLNTHTRLNVGGVSSTFRNSSSAPFHWRQDLNYSEVKQIEEQCTEAMHHWGYVKARNEFSLRDLNPVTNYTLMRNIDDIGTLVIYRRLKLNIPCCYLNRAIYWNYTGQYLRICCSYLTPDSSVYKFYNMALNRREKEKLVQGKLATVYGVM